MKKAIAKIKGSRYCPDIKGEVVFEKCPRGVRVSAEIYNLPQTNEGIFGFHIHEGRECNGNEADPFYNAKSHYNPEGVQHPMHRGDLPPLFANNGYALMCVLTDRFDLCEIVGKVIVIHSKPDDFTTQPGGNAGEKIACGVIKCL